MKSKPGHMAIESECMRHSSIAPTRTSMHLAMFVVAITKGKLHLSYVPCMQHNKIKNVHLPIYKMHKYNYMEALMTKKMHIYKGGARINVQWGQTNQNLCSTELKEPKFMFSEVKIIEFIKFRTNY